MMPEWICQRPPIRFEFNRIYCYVSVNKALKTLKSKSATLTLKRALEQISFGTPKIMPAAKLNAIDEDDLRRRVSSSLCNTIA